MHLLCSLHDLNQILLLICIGLLVYILNTLCTYQAPDQTCKQLVTLTAIWWWVDLVAWMQSLNDGVNNSHWLKWGRRLMWSFIFLSCHVSLKWRIHWLWAWWLPHASLLFLKVVKPDSLSPFFHASKNHFPDHITIQFQKKVHQRYLCLAKLTTRQSEFGVLIIRSSSSAQLKSGDLSLA